MSVTNIEWTKRPGTIGETWNPTTGCNKVDRGCKNCYAETMHKRLQAMGQPKYAAPFLDGAKCHPDTLNIPMGWTKPRTVFVNSMSDLFHHSVPFDFIAEVFQVIQLTPDHTYLVLTKRPERAVEFWGVMAATNPGWTPPPNLWMGTSANDQESAHKRIPWLLELDNVLLFLSYEPATGPLDLTNVGVRKRNALDGNPIQWPMDARIGRGTTRLDWVICGGESGSKAVPMHPAWARQVRDQCKEAGVPFFFKQFGQWIPFTFIDTNNGNPVTKFDTNEREHLFTDPVQNMIKTKDKSFNVLDGRIWQEFPKPQNPLK
jgi:protein gp37